MTFKGSKETGRVCFAFTKGTGMFALRLRRAQACLLCVYEGHRRVRFTLTKGTGKFFFVQVTHTGHPVIQVGAYDAYASYFTGVVVLTSNERRTDYSAAVQAMENQVQL